MPDCGLLISGVFQLDEGEGEAVYENNDVWASIPVAFHDSKLVYSQPVVIC